MMNPQIVSAPHSLHIIDINDLAIFCRRQSNVILSWRSYAKPLFTIPGTITPNSVYNEKGYDKSITLRAVSEGSNLADMLMNYSACRLIAIYTDARGHQRVCGSPEYPLRLSYTIQEGVATIVLTGRDIREDGYTLLG